MVRFEWRRGSVFLLWCPESGEIEEGSKGSPSQLGLQPVTYGGCIEAEMFERN
jgi:hypothetical protein